MRRTVPPSAEIQASIDKLLAWGMVDDPQKMLSELARLGAGLILETSRTPSTRHVRGESGEIGGQERRRRFLLAMVKHSRDSG